MQENGRDGKLLAIRDTPLLFPISSTRDVSRWISINRRGWTIKRERPTRRKRGDPRRARSPQRRDCTRRIRGDCICMRLRKRTAVASSTVVHARFRWPFRAGGGWRRSCSNYSTPGGTHLRRPPPLLHLHPRDVVLSAFARIEDATAGEMTIDRWEDDRLPTCASTRITLYFATAFLLISPTRSAISASRR